MGYECTITDEKGCRISFRPVEESEDIPVLYEWMHQKHIYPFWKLNVSREEIAAWVRTSLLSTKKRVFMGFLNDEPVSYLIGYDVKQDHLRHYYPVEAKDLGMHILIGPRHLLNRDDGETIIRAMTYFLFEKFGAKRIVGEPDYRNRIVIPILKNLGANVIKELQLPNKKAKLVIADREQFYEKLANTTIQSSFQPTSPPDLEWEEFSEESTNGTS